MSSEEFKVVRRARALHNAGGEALAEEGSNRKEGSQSPTVRRHLEGIYKSISGGDKALDRKEADAFLNGVQHVDRKLGLELLPDKNEVDFEDFLAYASSAAFDALAPPTAQDTSHPLSDYFVSSSHNTYLTGHQLYGDASVEGYKEVLEKGCRCIEVDVWDGESSGKGTEDEAPSQGENVKPWKSYESTTRAEPRVVHGYTLTKEVSFRRVCEAIKEAAFTKSDFPVVVSFELHLSLEQQEVMLEIVQSTWGDHLVALPPDSENCALPSLESLRKKILVKIKYTLPNEDVILIEPTPNINLSSSTSSADEGHSTPQKAAQKHSKKKVSILPELSQLGIYTRACHFSSFSQPEASMPTHIFSLSEKKFHDMVEKFPEKLADHNRRFLMRAYPKGIRVSSSNYDPQPYWQQGVQMVALNWQGLDAGMMLNEALFTGEGGWVLKPPALRSSVASHTPPQTLDLSIIFYAGQYLPLPPGEKNQRSFKPYVKVELRVPTIPSSSRSASPSTHRNSTASGTTAPTTPQIYKAKTRTRQGCDPDFSAERLAFKNVQIAAPGLTFLRFKVKDDTLGKDELAAWACIRLDRLREGYRFIELTSAGGKQFGTGNKQLDLASKSEKGVLLVKVEKKWH
ncbi:MAG: hypothetical protein M1814_002579 [Vezdaea aestivalis]|nr:MAG: hypothetical protein M1814_002579 [Vezdaea aestivalis]